MARCKSRARGFLAPFCALAYGCGSISPPPAQVDQVNAFVRERAGMRFDAASLLTATPDTQPPSGTLTLEQATDLALQKNLALIAASENLTIAHGQLMQAGLIQNPTLGQTSATLWPLQPAVGAVSFDVLISQTINSIITQPARVSVARVQEVQADIDLATQAFALTQQVNAKYQELIHTRRAQRLAQRISGLYARAVQAAEARSRVGVIPTPELNRARLSLEDARRQVQHLSTQHARAAQELNWLMGFSSPPMWRLDDRDVENVVEIPSFPAAESLEPLAMKYRLDLLRADLDRKAGVKGIELARLGMIPQTTIGLDYARDSSRNTFIGPQFQFTLPIFDPGVVAMQLAQTQARKADKTYAALEGQVRQDVRTALANWKIAADDISFYRQRLIPQQEENVRLMEMSFRLGNDDLDTLLNVYQSYVQQLQSFEDTVQAYYGSAVALQQATGLTWDRLMAEAGVQAPSAQSATEPATFPTSLPAVTAPATQEKNQ
jgi:cobalt-zinc-cadmium efflux system outer membrane protein